MSHTLLQLKLFMLISPGREREDGRASRLIRLSQGRRGEREEVVLLNDLGREEGEIPYMT